MNAKLLYIWFSIKWCQFKSNTVVPMLEIFDLNAVKSTSALEAFNIHEEMVCEYMSLLSMGYCLNLGVSHGKDSSIILNGALDAMSRAIAQQIIKPDHPIVIITIDTKLEPEAIQSYVPFAQVNVKAFCEKNKIHAFVETFSPPIFQELMVLYAGAQKLPASAMSGRHSDCSLLWKVNVGIDALKNIKKNLPNEYQKAVWISCSGSRNSESTRRKMNMQKQQVSDRKAQDLIAVINKDQLKKTGGTFKFAPIADLSDNDVINYLIHSGNDPMASTLVNKRISAYGDNFGLLLAVYGEGSNDTCDVVAIDSENRAEAKSCGGKIARFGCSMCLQVSQNHSEIEIKKGIRWGRFGDANNRFRDYLMRISTDVKYRAFHARAYDPASNNNVFLQPNVLKAKILEKMVWYASQISVDYTQTHQEALSLYKSGNIDKDVGVVDIENDSTLSPSVKAQYKKMYIDRLIERPMYELFSEKHAVLLSLMWSLHGVASLPYRPAAIFDMVKNGKRIPYPLTNSELNIKRASQGLPVWTDKTALNKTIPDALVARIITPAKQSFSELKSLHGDHLNIEHLQQYLPVSLSQYWENNNIQFDALGGVINTMSNLSKHTRKFNLTYQLDMTTSVQLETIKAIDVLTGRAMSLSNDPALHEKLMEIGRYNFNIHMESESEKYGMSIEEMMEILEEKADIYSVKRMHELNDQKSYISDVVYASPTLRVKPESTKNFSARKRIFDKTSKSYSAGRASLKVYKAKTVSALEEQASHTVAYWLPEFSSTRQASIDIHNVDLLCDDEKKQSFVFDDFIFSQWMNMGGWSTLLNTHNTQLRTRIENRTPVRTFSGTQAVYYLTTNSGLTTTKHFEMYMGTTLKRTEMFDSAGLFSLATKSYEEIKQHPLVVDMATHRTQKVDHLLAIRHIRNQRRVEIKAQMHSHALSESTSVVISNVLSRINEFALQYEDIAQKYLAAKVFSQLVSSAQLRVQKLETWLLEFNGATQDIDTALTLLATKQENQIINDCFDTKRLVTQAFEKRLSILTGNIKEVTQQTKDKVLSLNALNKTDFTIDGHHYEAVGYAKTSVNALASWIVLNYQGSNVFLVGYGITICLSQLHGHDYLSPVYGNTTSDNTQDKINRRSVTAKNMLNKMVDVFDLSTGELKHLLTVNKDTFKRQSVVKMTTKAKNNKLLELMSAQLKSA
jgi:3'-phosphoadenosine 5'-phosphosulfate sulfotransferase (PAPS reductase)/FAD synthetase